MNLPHSDGCFVKAYPAETAEAFCDGHVAAFDFFGGVPLSILYDNTRLAVARIVKGGRRLRSQMFAELQSHYLFDDRFGRPGKGNDKARWRGWSALSGATSRRLCRSRTVQTKRLESRINDGRKLWKLTEMDLKSYSRWHEYTRARDEMFLKTDTAWAPWRVAQSDDKKRVRLNVITHLLGQIPYEKTPTAKIELPKRDKAHGYVEVDYAPKLIPEVF
jgi:hypothetical protein